MVYMEAIAKNLSLRSVFTMHLNCRASVFSKHEPREMLGWEQRWKGKWGIKVIEGIGKKSRAVTQPPPSAGGEPSFQAVLVPSAAASRIT